MERDLECSSCMPLNELLNIVCEIGGSKLFPSAFHWHNIDFIITYCIKPGETAQGMTMIYSIVNRTRLPQFQYY